MVNEEKLRLMIDIALQEKKQEKMGIEQEMYYRAHYVRSNIFSTVWNLTVGYFFVLLLMVLYKADYIFVNVANINYMEISVGAIVIYMAIVVFGILFSYYYYTKKYVNNKSILKEYFRKIEKLSEFYEKDKEADTDDTFTRA